VVVSPGFSDELTHDDDQVEEDDPEVDDPPRLSVTPQKLLVNIMPGVEFVAEFFEEYAKPCAS